MIIVFMIMMMTEVLDYDDIVNLLPAQMSLLTDVYSRSTGRNPEENLGSDCCFRFLCAWWWLHKVATHSDVMLCVRKKSERGKHLPEEKPVDPHRRLTIAYSWWRGWYVVVIFNGYGGVDNDDDDEDDSCRLLTHRDVSRLRTHLTCNLHEF